MGLGDFGEVPNLEELMQLGVRTAKNGNKEGARVIFEKILAVDKRHERAWLWMASLSDDDIERRRYLQTVLNINPNNSSARKYLKAMDQSVSSSERRSLVVGGIIVGILVITLILVAIIVLVVTRV